MSVRWLISVAVAVLCACAHKGSLVSEGYEGPRASIMDTTTAVSQHRVEFYFASEVDGTPIQTNYQVAREFGYGKLFLISAPILQREVPAKLLRVKLEARVAYGAPIQEIVMAATMYTAARTVEFEPKPNTRYFVVGKLSEGGSDVWLEDEPSRTRVGRVVP